MAAGPRRFAGSSVTSASGPTIPRAKPRFNCGWIRKTICSPAALRGSSRDGLTVVGSVQSFSDRQRAAARRWRHYTAFIRRLLCNVRNNRQRLRQQSTAVDDLAADDFQALRAQLAKSLWRPSARQRSATHTHCVQVRLRCWLNRQADSVRADVQATSDSHHAGASAKEWQAACSRRPTCAPIIDKADQPLKAMILLGINCGFGNHDCGTLPQSALDLDKGWVDFPRPKTAVERRCPLWPETVKALREAMAKRPKAKRSEHDKLIFVTRYGQPWAKENGIVKVSVGEETKTTRPVDSPITKQMRKLLDELKLYRPGLGFYALRHTFETVAGGGT